MTSNIETIQFCGDIQEQTVAERDCCEEANDEGKEHDQGRHSLSPGYFQVKSGMKYMKGRHQEFEIDRCKRERMLQMETHTFILPVPN